MTRFVLDIDTVVDVLRGRYGVASRLAEQSPDDCGVVSMTAAELFFGSLASSDSDRNRAEVERFLAQIRVFGFGRRAASIHADLRWKLRPRPIGPHDLLIAATALSTGGTLVTANTREFSRVPGLQVESWRS